MHCRGVGADFVVAELMTIANALLGTQDIVPDPADLRADFASMMQTSLRKQVGAVTLRVWTPRGGHVVVLKQMEPAVDLSGARVEVSELVGEYPTGPWGDESRDYHLSVRVPPGEVVDDKMAAARVTLVVDGETAGQTPVLARWTDDVALSTRLNRRVAEVMNQTVLAHTIQRGVDARPADDTKTATDELGVAVRLAHESENSEVLERLSKIVEVDDPATGRVRPKVKVEEVDVMIAESRSVRTERTGRRAPSAAPATPRRRRTTAARAGSPWRPPPRRVVDATARRGGVPGDHPPLGPAQPTGLPHPGSVPTAGRPPRAVPPAVTAATPSACPTASPCGKRSSGRRSPGRIASTTK